MTNKYLSNIYPLPDTQNVNPGLHRLVNELRQYSAQVMDSRGQALFATSMELLTDLARALDDSEKTSVVEGSGAGRQNAKITSRPR